MNERYLVSNFSKVSNFGDDFPPKSDPSLMRLWRTRRTVSPRYLPEINFSYLYKKQQNWRLKLQSWLILKSIVYYLTVVLQGWLSAGRVVYRTSSSISLAFHHPQMHPTRSWRRSENGHRMVLHTLVLWRHQISPCSKHWCLCPVWGQYDSQAPLYQPQPTKYQLCHWSGVLHVYQCSPAQQRITW